MRTNVTGEHITLTPDIYAYLNKKMAHVEKMLGDAGRYAVAHVEIGKTTEHHKSGNLFEAKVTMSVDGKDFTEVAEGETLYGAIDRMKDDICRELTSYKDKKITLVRRGGRSVKNILRRLWPFGSREE